MFEAFEASPLSEDVLASQATLQWDFPGCAVAISISTFEIPAFQEELAVFLEKASCESIKRFAGHTTKAGSFAYESRESVDPALVTQMLMTLLEVNGSRISPQLLRKRVRDDVSWDSAEIPWRRSPFWLSLRVAVQRHLYAILGSGIGRMRYKFLICSVLAQLLNDSLGHLGTELLVHVRAKLCRRLTKLEVARERSPDRAAYDHIFAMLQPFFETSIATASNHSDGDWARFR